MTARTTFLAIFGWQREGVNDGGRKMGSQKGRKGEDEGVRVIGVCGSRAKVD